MNVALGLWWNQTGAPRFAGDFEAWHALAALDLASWVGVELGLLWRPGWWPGRWLPRSLLLASLLFATSTGAWATWNHGNEAVGLGLWGIVVVASALGGARDPALWGLGGMAILLQSASWLGKHGISDAGRLAPLEGMLRWAAVGFVLVLEIVALTLAIRWGARRVREVA